MQRNLTKGEKAFIMEMLKYTDETHIFSHLLDQAIVEEMDDGGMGSLKFIYENVEQALFGRDLIAVQFKDVDYTLVIASIYLDRQDKLFEIDVWKVDFSPLCHELNLEYKISKFMD